MGQYVGLAKAKRALIETEERELQLLAERQLLEEEREKQETRAHWSREVVVEDEVGAEQDGPRRNVLFRETPDAVDTIIKVAAKSSNLKGTFQKMLKNAAKSIADAAKELTALSSTEEITSLERENKRLRNEVSSIKDELAALREEIRGSRLRPKDTQRVTKRVAAAPPSTATSSREDEKMEVVGIPHPLHHTEPLNTGGRDSSTLGQREKTLMGAFIRQFGEIMARFAAIEDRLLPEKRLRPPLGKPAREEADTKVEDPPLRSVSDLPRKVLPQRAAKEAKKKGNVPPRESSVTRKKEKRERKISPPPTAATTKPGPSTESKGNAASSVNQESLWSQVVGRRARKSQPSQKGASSNPKGSSSTSLKSGGLSPSGRDPPKKGASI
jgi:hypothetical protein